MDISNDTLEAWRHGMNHDVIASLLRAEQFFSMIEDDNSDYLPYVRSSLREARVKASAVRDLMSIFMQPLKEALVPINAFFSEWVSSMSAEMGVAVDACIVAEGLSDIQGDPELVARLFKELISNALLYHDPEKALRLTLSSTETSEGVCLNLTTTAKPIDPNYLDEIFRLFRILAPIKSDTIHYGCGLAIVKAIADRHGASLTYKPCDTGTTLEIFWPKR